MFETTALDVITARRPWLLLLRLPNVIVFRSLGWTFLNHRVGRAPAIVKHHYKVAHGAISEFWTRHWDSCTKQMKEAIESSSAVRGVCVKFCSTPNVPSNESFKWEKVSFVSNLYYVQKEIRTWGAYGIGPERVFPGLSSMSLNNQNCRQWRSDPLPARLSQALFP